MYPIVLALLSVVLKPLGAGLFETGIVLSAIAAGVVVFLHYRLVAALFSPVVALAATLFVVLNPIFVRYSYTAGTDMFFAALALLAVALTLRATTLRWGRVAAVGVAFASVYLTRYNGVLFLTAALVSIVLVNVWDVGWKKRLAAAAAILGIFIVIIAPWAAHCHAEMGAYFYNLNFRNVVLSMLPDNFDSDYLHGVDLRELNGFGDVFRAFHTQLLISMPGRAWDQFTGGMGQMMRWPVGAIVILGMIALAMTRPTRKQVGYYLFALLLFLGLLLVFFNERFGLYLVPVYATVAVAGLARLSAVVGKRRNVQVAVSAVVVALLGFGAITSYGYVRRVIPGVNPEIREMVDLFERVVPPHERGRSVVARKPAFAYFAGLEHLPLPIISSHDVLLGYLASRNADYLFFSRLTWRTRPELGYLAQFDKRHRGLSLVFRHDLGLLYRVEKPGP